MTHNCPTCSGESPYPLMHLVVQIHRIDPDHHVVGNVLLQLANYFKNPSHAAFKAIEERAHLDGWGWTCDILEHAPYNS